VCFVTRVVGVLLLRFRCAASVARAELVVLEIK
jgi:hypothetical protein